MASVEAKKLADEQQAFMEEMCIEVDRKDKALRPVSKRESHKNTAIRAGMLHRAFSVFLFNEKGQLLLQQRSRHKITFPLAWTNTCCSHPLWRKEEMEEDVGVKRAAIRKLEHELGISEGTIKLEEIHFLTKILYQAPSDGEWGEAEVDHILFVKKNVEHKINEGELESAKYVNIDELKDIFTQHYKNPTEVLVSPWFHMICNNFFYKWWGDLDTIIKNKGIGDKERETIHELSLGEASKL